jgi:hypothetical protein
MSLSVTVVAKPVVEVAAAGGHNVLINFSNTTHRLV